MKRFTATAPGFFGSAGLCALVLATAPIALGASAPNVPDLSLEELSQLSGYTPEEIQKNFPPIQEWSRIDPSLQPDTLAATFDRSRFNPPPAPGEHPRVYFGPGDLPAIRERLEKDPVARAQWESIKARLLQLSPRSEDWEGIPRDAAGMKASWAGFVSRGLRPDLRAGYRGPWVGGWVNELAAGGDPEGLKGHWGEPVSKAPGRQFLMNLLPWEAFRCLVENDEEGGRRAAAALTRICELFSQHPELYFYENNSWQKIYQLLSSHAIGLAYDWGYPFLTDAQRQTVREFIAKVTRGKTFYAINQVPAFPAGTTNHITIHMNLLCMVLAIEGEQGYDPMVYERCLEGMRKWVYVAAGPLGVPFEDLTKSTYAPRWLIPLAKRGEPMIGTEWFVNHVRKYQLGVMLPWGDQFVFGNAIGKPRREATFKYAHPTDPVVDYIYSITDANQSLFGPDPHPEWSNIRTTYAPLWADVFTVERPLGLAADGSYDWQAARDAMYAHLKKIGEPLTYYSDYGGVLTARTAWDADAAFLFFEPRNVPGGHTFDSRNDFVIASHGRLWSTRGTYWAAEGGSDRRSLIQIDGKGQGHQCLPGKTLEMVDSPLATFCAGDATMAYSYKAGIYNAKTGTGDQLYMDTPNQGRLVPGKLPWMDLTWGELPGWDNGIKGGGRHSRIAPFNPVRYAYRTVGLVKGAHPYFVLADDLRKDDAVHQYDWLMQVPPDLKLLSSGPSEEGGASLVLGDEQGRRLLIRVLEAGENAGEFEELVKGARLEPYSWKHHAKEIECLRLVLPLNSVTARYRLVMLPYKEGDAVPQCAWNPKTRTATVSYPGQTNRIRFAEGENNRTSIVLEQGDKRLATGMAQ